MTPSGMRPCSPRTESGCSPGRSPGGSLIGWWPQPGSGACVLPASGYAERAAALELLGALDRDRRLTLGADKGYDTRDFVAAVRLLGVTPHVAQNTGHRRRSAIDDRTTRHAGYAVSQQRRKRVEEIFGWLKTIGLMRKTRHRGTRRVDWMFTFALAAYNLVRIRTLTTQSA